MPANIIYLGSPVTISNAAFGTPPFSYQWQTDGGSGGNLTNIPNATNASLTTIPDTVGTYKYDVVVSDSSVSSRVRWPRTVLPASAPIITQDTGTADFGPVTNIFAFIGGNCEFLCEFRSAQCQSPISGCSAAPVVDTLPLPAPEIIRGPLPTFNPSSVGFYKLAAPMPSGSSNSTPSHLTALADPAAPASIGVTNMYSYCVYTNHPWAYWKFEETNDTLTSSMQAYDYSGHNFDATYGNSDGSGGLSGCLDGGENISINSQYGPNPNDYLNGYPGFPANNGCAGLSYSSNNGYLKVPPLNLNTNTVTFTMWIYPNDAFG